MRRAIAESLKEEELWNS